MAIDWSALQNDQNEVQTYQVEWTSYETKKGVSEILSGFLDTSFSWVNEVLSGRYETIESQRKAMLQADPSLQMTNRSDGYELEADRLLAIQQRNSRGFTIIDINPGLLTRQEFPLTLPYEFLFDGTNFMPDSNQSLISNFRTVNIPVQGNYVKVEYLWETNSRANLSNVSTPRPYASRKYTQITGNEQNLSVGQQSYTMDNFARNKVFVNFSSVTEKPIIIKRNGESFKTWFNEVNVTLNMGAPKIRIIIGMNSEMQEGSAHDAINARMSLTGSARMLADSDTVLSPFSICEQDNFQTVFKTPGNVININGNTATSFNLIQNLNAVQSAQLDYLGYAVLWITKIRFRVASNGPTATTGALKVSLLVTNVGASDVSRVHIFTLTANNLTVISGGFVGETEYEFEPAEPIRVVIPSYSSLTMYIAGYTTALTTWEYSFEINGYSLGEIISLPVADLPGATYLVTSKYVTDSTFLSDFNRVSNIRRFN